MEERWCAAAGRLVYMFPKRLDKSAVLCAALSPMVQDTDDGFKVKFWEEIEVWLNKQNNMTEYSSPFVKSSLA